MNKIALITGASGGIGMYLAHQFAQHNTNVFLAARSHEKLKRLSEQLQNQYGITAYYKSVDLSKLGDSRQLVREIEDKGLFVKYLVNNAGVGDYGLFTDRPWDKYEHMMQLNMTSLTYLTYALLPAMRKAGEGRIMNVASVAAFIPGPFMAVYYATKHYVLALSQALYEENRDKNISVTTLCPGPTNTGFGKASQAAETKVFSKQKLPTGMEVASFGYKAMMRGKLVAVHGRKYRWMNLLKGLVPRKVLLHIVRNMHSQD
ncbi:MAG: SDR family NAD(P)-dependent oxidoreductase [Bacteroidales bacterium]